MSITIFAVICALMTGFTLLLVYGIFAIRRKSGKSDIRHSRIVLRKGDSAEAHLMLALASREAQDDLAAIWAKGIDPVEQTALASQ